MRILVGLWLGLLIITPAWAAGTATPASQGFAAVSPSKALPQRGKTPRELANRSSKTRSDLKKGIQAMFSGDYAKALSIYKPLAEHGDADAQLNLGGMYASGREGVPQDHAKALYWYRKAAAQGFVEAQTALGVMYANGHGVAQDYAKALYWFRKAAVQGDAGAQFSLGAAYYNGQGVPPDYAKAAYWYRKAAAQGFEEAQSFLGVMYDNGLGGPQDYAKAAYWYRKAAAQGDAEAQYNLGWMYVLGLSVPRDYIQAAKWLILARTGGLELLPETGSYEQVNKALSFLKQHMTRAQLAEAQRLSNQWWEAHHKQ